MTYPKKAIPVKTQSLFCIVVLAVLGLFYSCTTTQAALADKKAYTEDNIEYRKKFNFTVEDGEKPLRYGYHYVVSSIPDGYKVRVFHPEKQTLTEEKTFSTPALTLMHGFYKSWWDDGSIREQGTYQFGRKHGIWLENEPAKGKSASGEYMNHRKEGLWTQLDSNGMVESVFTWQDNKRHGKFLLYDSSGQKVNEGLYRNDTLIAELFKVPLITKPYLKNCNNELISDVFECTENVLTQFVYSELKYPPSARQNKMEGTVVAQWDVYPDGAVRNIRVPQSLSKEIESEVIRVLERMPAWSPSMKDGMSQKATVTLPINFRLAS